MNDDSSTSTLRDLARCVSALERARAGSDAALGELLEGCRQYLMLIAQKELDPDLRVKSAASDLVQETFVSAGRHFREFRGTSEGEFLAWLRRILLHHLISQRRRYFQTKKREERRVCSLEELSESSIQPRGADRANSPSQHAIHFEEQRMVERALEHLEERYRRVILLRHREQLSFEDIAEKMGVSAPAARQLWVRAITHLRRQVSAVSSERGPRSG